MKGARVGSWPRLLSRCCRVLLLLCLLSLLLAPDPASGAKTKKKAKKKYKVVRHKDGPLKNPSMIARCSACRAVASDLAERLEPFQSKSPSEIQMMEVIEGPDDLGHNLGHICMAMKVRWHYLTIMDGVDRFSEAEIKAFAKRAGEPLAKWVPTTEEETWPQEKKELLANRRKLAEYCTTLVERTEDTLIPHVQDRSTRPSSAEAMGDYLCTELTEECPKPAPIGLPPGLDLSQFPPEVQAQLAAQMGQS